MGFFDIFKKQDSPVQEVVSNGKQMIFSTPFMKIGSGNLSLPQVNKYYTVNNIVRFGADNLYPQLLNQMYYSSAIHSACIDFTTGAVISGGLDWKNEAKTSNEKLEQLTFMKKYKIQKLSKQITRDFVIHRRVCIRIVKNNEGVLKIIERLDPSTIRNCINNKLFIWSDDWSRGLINEKPYKLYKPGCKETETLYVFQDETPGQDVYPIPAYNSVLNWLQLDAEIAFLQKSNIQNSVFPSIVVRRPKTFDSLEELDMFRNEIGSQKGAQNAGNLMVLTGNGKDDVPEVIQIKANDNDKLFKETKKDLVDSICFAHMINPSIMGVKVSGSLGNKEEIEISNSLFEKNVVWSLRDIITEIINDLVDIANIPNTLIIKEWEIIDKVAVDTTDKNNIE
jgi:hypothetical protein